MHIDLNGKRAIVTGAARGIGREIARVLAGAGAVLALLDLLEEDLRRVAEEIEERGGRILAIPVNVADHDAVQQAIQGVIAEYGGVDILVNNAGIVRDGFLLRMKEDQWDAVLEVNLKGAFNCTKAVLKTMMKQRSGRIVNVASVVGLAGNAGQANYAASKAGIIGFTKSAAKELASRGITVNAVAPGLIETDMTASLSDDMKQKALELIPLGRSGTPGDVAGAVLFLVSPLADYITGEVLRVDGGMVM
jgi:3-oxoacyl-[acyl-carrier protein] reductase